MMLMSLVLIASVTVVRPSSDELDLRGGFELLIPSEPEDGSPEMVPMAGQRKPSANCPPSAFESIELPEGTSEDERTRLERVARVAILSEGLPTCECRVSFSKGPWPGVDVVRIETSSCFSLTMRYVAVDAEDRTFLLTGDVLRGGGETSLAEAIRDLNALARLQEVQIEDRVAAQEYLESVLAMFRLREGAFLPSRAVADDLAPRRYDDPVLADWIDALIEQRRAYVEIVKTGPDGWEGRSYQWRFWCGCGSIDELLTTVGPHGEITVRARFYAEQSWSPPPS